MSQPHVKNIKKLIDHAISRGLFIDGEGVQAILDSYRYIQYAVQTFEEYGDLSQLKRIDPDNSERIMPEKSISDRGVDG